MSKCSRSSSGCWRRRLTDSSSHDSDADPPVLVACCVASEFTRGMFDILSNNACWKGSIVLRLPDETGGDEDYGTACCWLLEWLPLFCGFEYLFAFSCIIVVYNRGHFPYHYKAGSLMCTTRHYRARWHRVGLIAGVSVNYTDWLCRSIESDRSDSRFSPPSSSFLLISC